MDNHPGCLRCGRPTAKAEHAWCSQRCRGLFGAWKTWQAATADGRDDRALALRRCADVDNDRADVLQDQDATSPEARRLRNRVARAHERADALERYARSLRALVRPRLPAGEMAA